MHVSSPARIQQKRGFKSRGKKDPQKMDPSSAPICRRRTVPLCCQASRSHTCLQRYSENLLNPSSCKPSSGKILKKRSTWGRSPSFVATANFSVTMALRRCSASCSSFRLASIMLPAQWGEAENQHKERYSVRFMPLGLCIPKAGIEHLSVCKMLC